MTYEVEFAKAAESALEEIPKSDQKKIAKKIDKLSSGQDDFYRIRQGDYRIIYSVFEARLIILIVKVGHRREVYR